MEKLLPLMLAILLQLSPRAIQATARSAEHDGILNVDAPRLHRFRNELWQQGQAFDDPLVATIVIRSSFSPGALYVEGTGAATVFAAGAALTAGATPIGFGDVTEFGFALVSFMIGERLLPPT